MLDEPIIKLKELITDSERVLVASHISPDPDAVSSLLLMSTVLQKNFPDKEITAVLEEEPLGLDFLDSYKNIVFTGLAQAIEKQNPSLVILLDGNNFDRASRHEGENVRQMIKSKGIKTIIIDHHELTAKDDCDAFINRHDPATAQTVYELLSKDLGLDMPVSAVQTAMTGYYADTGGFVYLKDGRQSGVFSFVEELISKGADIEAVKNQLEQYSLDDLKVIAELADNAAQTGQYSYSFVSDEFIADWLKDHKQAELQRGTGVFLDSYIRNINGRKWGFIVYRNSLQGENIYSVSLRSVNGVKDVAQIANRFDGGGHKSAAGAKLYAESVAQAVDKIRQSIADNT